MTKCAVTVEVGLGQATVSSQEDGEIAPVFDSLDFLARLDGDTQLACDLIDLFVEDYPEKMALIAEGIRNGNSAQVRLAAHALRGTVAIFGAHTVQKIAHRLEHLGRSGALSGASDLHNDLIEALARLRSDLNELKNGLSVM